LNFIFDIICLFVCVCAFSLRRESSNMILGDKPLISDVVLSQFFHDYCFYFVGKNINYNSEEDTCLDQ
jgi:hypothetical protein